MDKDTFWEQFRAAATLRSETIVVECSGTTHRMRLDDSGLEPMDHDVISEEALFALGGDLPWCIQLGRAWSLAIHMDSPVPLFMYEGPFAERQRAKVGVSANRPGFTLSVRRAARLFGINVSDEMGGLLTLASSGESIRKHFLTHRLVSDYEAAQPVVKELAAQLGLQIAAGTHRLTDTTLIDIKELYGLPRFSIGPTEWSKKELLLLMTTGRFPKDEARRKRMLSELAMHLEEGVSYTKEEVGALLRRFTFKPWALLKALTVEGMLIRERGTQPSRRGFVWMRSGA